MAVADIDTEQDIEPEDWTGEELAAEVPADGDLQDDVRQAKRQEAAIKRAARAAQAQPATRVWTKVQVRVENASRLRAWFLAVYPDERSRPPLREAADILMGLALDNAEKRVKPKPTPLAELAALRNGS